MEPSSFLAARQLTRVADDKTLVEGVSFDVARGDVFVIFGPSGAGKSTLLRLINRLDEPTRGTVYLEGTDYRAIPPRTLRQRIGLVPQQPTLRGGTVAENIAWGPVLRDEPVDGDALHRLLERLGLGGFADRDTADLSGGEAKRVAIARTLFNDPDIVLLDEPASSLDVDAARRVEELLKEVIAELSLTAILVTHDANRAQRLGTRGLQLEDGKPVRTGPVRDVISSVA